MAASLTNELKIIGVRGRMYLTAEEDRNDKRLYVIPVSSYRQIHIHCRFVFFTPALSFFIRAAGIYDNNICFSSTYLQLKFNYC